MSSAVLERPDFHVPLHRLPIVKARFWTADRNIGLVLALLGATVVAWGVGLFPALLGDEGTYSDQAQSVLHGQLTPYTYIYDHPFFGWLQLAPLQGLVHLVLGNGQLLVVESRIAMIPFTFATLLFTYHIARRMQVRRVAAAGAVVLLAASPLFITESRAVLLDNIALPWVLASFYLALTPSRRQWIFGLAGVTFAVGVLSKETVVLVLPALGYVIWTRSYKPIRMMTIATFMTLGTLVVLVYPLFAILRGELIPGPGHVSLWSNGIMYQLASRSGSGAVWQHGTGRYDLVSRALHLDFVLLAVGSVAALGCLFSRRLRFVGLALLLWSVPVLKPSGYLPQMYVILALPLFALAIAGMIDVVAGGVHRLPGGSGSAARAVVALVCALAVGGVVVHDVPEVRQITTDQANNQVEVARQAENWVIRHASRSENILLDPAYWGDLVEDGFDHPWHGVISYYQFDLDPLSSQRYLPQAWRDVSYVVETQEMRDNITPLGLTRLAATIAHSHVIARFGHGANQVVIRAVDPTAYNFGSTR